MKPASLPDPLPSYLTVTEAALLLRVTRRTILNWLRGGTLPGTKVGHQWRIPTARLLGTLTDPR